VVDWSHGAERITGWQAGEILGRSYSCLFAAEDVAVGRPEKNLCRARKEGIFMEEGWRIRKDGTRYLANVTLTALCDGKGQLTGFSKATRDITLLKEAESRLQALAGELEAQVQAKTAELQESQTRLLGFIRHACAAIAFKDLDGHFLLINPSCAALFGRTEAEILGRTLADLFPLEVCSPWMEQERGALERRQGVQKEWPYAPDGGPVRWYLAHVFPLTDDRGQDYGAGLIITDITELKEAEGSRVQVQKLEALGILAGGLAHDFNNLLGAMESNVELARLETGPDTPVQPYLQTLEGLIRRSAGLVAQILAFSGRGQATETPLDLNRQVETVTRLLRASLSRKAVLQVDAHPGLPPILGDPGQVQQVVMNLVINAAEAVADHGGVITVRTGLESLDAPAAFQGQVLDPGPYVLLEVSDNGPGMPPDVVERVFDPFFTTKFPGRGLGLSSVRGTVLALRGCLRVHSEPGRGTSFGLLFPAAAEQSLPEDTESRAAEEGLGSWRGSGTVLVVDDEEPLRLAAVQAFRRIGFETVEARDGVEAVRAFEAHRERVRLVLLDLTMPRMDGEEAYRVLRGHGLLAPVILTSGFAEVDVRQQFLSRGIAEFLQKPYRLASLVQAARKALAREEEARLDDLQPRPSLTAKTGTVMGCELLDRQHLHILDAFNQLAATLGKDGQRQRQEQALAGLTELALTHFGVEETIMEKLAYPHAQEHQRSHARLAAQISDLTARIRQGSLSITPSLLDYLECWLVHHAQDEDRRLAQFLLRKGH
jgi:hemerythrin-like metal-binding protein/PAS domain S-box-containing protein